jgi:hypothetical protein
MNTLKTPRQSVSSLAVSVQTDDEMLHVQLDDGRIISVPLEWFPRLRDATPAERENWRLIGRGVGVHWEEIDEDISVKTLLAT